MNPTYASLCFCVNCVYACFFVDFPSFTLLTVLFHQIRAVQLLFAGHYYSEALYDRTADFDNISFLEAQPDEALRKD